MIIMIGDDDDDDDLRGVYTAIQAYRLMSKDKRS